MKRSAVIYIVTEKLRQGTSMKVHSTAAHLTTWQVAVRAGWSWRSGSGALTGVRRLWFEMRCIVSGDDAAALEGAIRSFRVEP